MTISQVGKGGTFFSNLDSQMRSEKAPIMEKLCSAKVQPWWISLIAEAILCLHLLMKRLFHLLVMLLRAYLRHNSIWIRLLLK